MLPNLYPVAPGTPAPQSGLPSLVFALLFIACFSLIAVSGNVLALFGINYAGAGGNPLAKIHPSAYLLVFGLMAYLTYPDERNQLVKAVIDPSVKWGLVCVPLVILYTQFFLGKPVANLIVSWFVPFLLMALLNGVSAKQSNKLEYLLYGLMALNSVMGVVEFLRGAALIPPVLIAYTGNGEALDMTNWGEWRASGLFGHPLTATLVCGTLAVTLFARRCFDQTTHLQSFTLLHTMAVMPLFGGRTSIFVMVFCFLLIIIARLLQDHLGKPTNRIDYLKATLWFIFIALMIVFAYMAGYFDKFIDRMNYDQGSARTRIAAIEILLDTPWDEWLFGDFRNMVLARQIAYGTIYGVEIFWIAMLLTYGLIANLSIYIPTIYLFIKLTKSHANYEVWAILFFVLAISSGIGLAAKTNSLSLFVLIIFCCTRTNNSRITKTTFSGT